MCHNISRPTTCGLCRSKSPTFAVCASPSCALLFCKAYNAQSPTLVYLGEKFNWKDSLSFSLSLSWTLSSAAVIVLGGGNDLRTVRPISHTIAPTCSSSLRFLYLPQDRTFPVKPVIGLWLKNKQTTIRTVLFLARTIISRRATPRHASLVSSVCVCVCAQASARTRVRWSCRDQAGNGT